MQASGDIFDRTRLLVGDEGMSRLAAARVIVFGVGGVGSWCAEALVRSGIGQLTLVDPDVVAASNVNRQLMATSENIGQVKVEALRERLLSINPSAGITALAERFSAENADTFELSSYDYVVDAIDSLSDKTALILAACASPAKLFSSMGAARKLDPTHVKVAEFWNVRGCPLGQALRKRFRRTARAAANAGLPVDASIYPARKFLCVYDEDVLDNRGSSSQTHNGTLAHITGIFGLTLAGLVIQDICVGEGSRPSRTKAL